MELTGAINKGSTAQYLDKLQVERERGITVKVENVCGRGVSIPSGLNSIIRRHIPAGPNSLIGVPPPPRWAAISPKSHRHARACGLQLRGQQIPCRLPGSAFGCGCRSGDTGKETDEPTHMLSCSEMSICNYLNPIRTKHPSFIPSKGSDCGQLPPRHRSRPNPSASNQQNRPSSSRSKKSGT